MGCTAGKEELSRWTHKRGTTKLESRIRYLPFELKGARVLVKEAAKRYRIDNSRLCDRAQGVCFRRSKSIGDKDSEHIAFWNQVVTGEETGDGWICCDIDEDCLEFLNASEKESLLQPLSAWPQRCMVAQSTSSNVDGSWLSRGHAGAKRISGDIVRYSPSLSTTLTWDGLNSFVLQVSGEQRRARLIEDSLVWHDGDVWMRDPRQEVLKATELHGDDLQAEVAPFHALCLKGKKPGSPNQDAWSVVRVEHEFSIYMVFDGHGPQGHDVANFAKELLPRLLLKSEPPAMFEAFRELHQLIDTADAHDKLSASWSGTTCTAVLHRGQKLQLAHVGDSTAVVGGFDGKELYASRLTRDHKPTLKDEKARILKAGGVIDYDGYSDWRIYNKDGFGAGLNMTRSLGDLEAHRDTGLIADPELQEYQVGPNDQVLLLCSDGIWEFMKPEEAVDLVLSFPRNRGAQAVDALAREARYRWLREAEYIDDISVLLVYLNPKRMAFAGGA